MRVIATLLAAGVLLVSCGPYLCKNLDIVLDDSDTPKRTKATLVCDGAPIVEAEVDILSLPFSSPAEPEPCTCEAPK